jgi:hypothetical protein
VTEPSWRWSTLDSRLNPATRIQIKDVSVVQVSVALRFASIVVTLIQNKLEYLDDTYSKEQN